ncbi:hypothetical protein BD626DRAFT_569332 [Schizophyllum amplum]|uniref:HNH nuclease domain-containing protein n=1 Tax=Schizophyllum amplum TaxID=97359 RepID=A0A550CET0_9AGAR|nr:hypothetical protein BD626DRAFT_569332 [Auriculariopsis ampla]
MDIRWRPTELPAVDSPEIAELIFEPNWTSAYRKVIALEDQYSKDLANMLQDQHTNKDRTILEAHLMYLRVVGWLYVFEGGTCRLQLSQWILSCEDDETIIDLGRFLCEHYIRAFRKSKGRMPFDSSDPSRNYFDCQRENLDQRLVTPLDDHATAQSKAHARDNHQCAFIKWFSFSAPISQRDLPSSTKRAILRSAPALPNISRREDVQDNPDAVRVPFCALRCAHILSEPTNQDIHRSPDKRVWAASVSSIFERFGHVDICDELKGPLVHRLENIISVSHDIHDDFDNLNIWLEHVGEPDGHRYRVCGPNAIFFAATIYSDDGIIEFTTPDDNTYPLPSRKYIKLHAAACNVAHMSGAADHFDNIDRVLEEDRVLAEDGHQVFVLEHRLQQAMNTACGRP